jgi:DNA invertase Pin-like site-specific DNA recombinase
VTEQTKIPPAVARAMIYARFSSDNQRDASIEDQLRVCRARAEREGWRVVAIYTDHAMSGATTMRAGYQALLSAVREGDADIVVAESLDRFSRDLEHIAAFFKQSAFNNVRIHTLAEGDVSELHVGLKGVMGALYLKDPADKTRRGLEGRIHAGRCTGSPAYGYTVVRKMGDDGELDRGLRAIDPETAAVVRRIFAEYAAGVSPCKIARALNIDGIPGPGGGIWYETSIRGREKRRDGILRNSLYAGQIVWRRRVSLKDPVTGARKRRDASPESYVTSAVPDLRIIDGDLWGASRQGYWRRRLAPLPSRAKVGTLSGTDAGPATFCPARSSAGSASAPSGRRKRTISAARGQNTMPARTAARSAVRRWRLTSWMCWAAS